MKSPKIVKGIDALLRAKLQRHDCYYYRIENSRDEMHRIQNDGIKIVRLTKNNVQGLDYFRNGNVIREISSFINNNQICIAAEIDDNFVGHAVCSCEKMKYDGLNIKTGGYIYYCYVAEECRGNNIYPLMLQSIIKIATDERGVEKFIISTNQNNIPSQKGIEKVGFMKRTPYHYYTFWKYYIGGRKTV